MATVAPIVGIDFGTTNSSISVCVQGRALVVPDSAGQTLQPSIVSFPASGAPIVGWDARDRVVTEPQRTVTSIKRLLGRAFSDPSIAGHLQSFPFRTSEGPNGTIVIDMGDRQWAVGQIVALILGHLRDMAERQLVGTRRAVVSIPVSFGEAQKAALRRAGQLANIEIVELIEEPLACALAYGMGRDKHEIVAVYDFGGGTFDFTVLDLHGDDFRVLASEGDAWLGGDDFDLALAQAAAENFWRKTKVDLTKRAVEWQRLRFACEQAKRLLSTMSSAEILVERIVEAPRPMDLVQVVDRRFFERLCRDYFERSLGICEAALGRAGVEPRDVTQVVLSSGISYIPFVREGLARYFEREITTVVDPDKAICVGAGLRAARLSGHAIDPR